MVSEQDVFAIGRPDVPDTNALQRRILKQTESMEQSLTVLPVEISEHEQQRAKQGFWQSLGLFFLKRPLINSAVTLVAVIIMTASFVPIGSVDQASETVAIMPTPEHTLYELEWHDLTFMQDELAFAGL